MNGEQFLDSILTSLKDIAKFKIIKSVDTGDRGFDNLVQMILITIVTFLIGSFNWKKLKTYWKLKCLNKILTQQQSKELRALQGDDPNFKYQRCTWYIDYSEEGDFTDKFVNFFVLNYESFLCNTKLIDTKLGKLTDETLKPYSFRDIKDIFAEDVFYPLYYKNGQTVGLINGNSMYIGYTCKNLLEEFVNLIVNQKTILKTRKDKSEDEDEQKKEKKQFHVIEKGYKHILYTDRNMDMFVSRHKPTILKCLNTFISIQKGIVPFGGFVSHNLGIILYGPPGTGKTLLIQAICNYLERDGHIVDMKSIKTTTAFKDLFAGPEMKRKVFILDEFDMVQGVIKNRSDQKEDDKKEEEKEELNAIEKLRNRKLEIMKIMANGGDKDKDSNLTKEMDRIDQEIVEYQSKLRLDTMLTVFQGTVESRGRVVIACTNHLDRIDPALIREGRFSLKIHLGKFNTNEIRELLLKMFNVKVDENIKFKEDTYTPAQLIDMAIKSDSLEELIKQIRE